MPTEKRRQQNREAQRRWRLRHRAMLAELRAQVAEASANDELIELRLDYAAARREIASLQRQIDRLTRPRDTRGRFTTRGSHD